MRIPHQQGESDEMFANRGTNPKRHQREPARGLLMKSVIAAPHAEELSERTKHNIVNGKLTGRVLAKRSVSLCLRIDGKSKADSARYCAVTRITSLNLWLSCVANKTWHSSKRKHTRYQCCESRLKLKIECSRNSARKEDSTANEWVVLVRGGVAC